MQIKLCRKTRQLFLPAIRHAEIKNGDVRLRLSRAKTGETDVKSLKKALRLANNLKNLQ